MTYSPSMEGHLVATTQRTTWICLLTMTAVLTPASAHGQAITGFGGYRVGGSLTGYNGDRATTKDNWSFGGSLTVPLQRQTGVEFLYSHQGTEVKLIPVNGDVEYFDANIDQWAIGGYRELAGSSEKVVPVTAGYLGLTHLYGDGASETRFMLGAGLGAKINASERVALRLDAKGYFTFASSGGGVWCNPVCTVGYSGSVFFQADFTAGLSVALGKTRR